MSLLLTAGLKTLSTTEGVESASHWTDFAMCKGRTALFFPPKAERPQARERREARARQLCAQCPVIAP